MPSSDSSSGPVLDAVRQLVVKVAPGAARLADDESLFGGAIVDSLGFLAILRGVEERFGVALSGGDVVLADLGTIGGIAAFVAPRVAPGAPPPLPVTAR